MSNKRVFYEKREYTLLHRHSAGSFQWTKAYRLDNSRHIQLLQLTENSDNGAIQAESMYLHYADVKKLMLDVLRDEIGDPVE